MLSSKERRFSQIGLDRLVRLQWLEKTASLVHAGNIVKDIKTILQNDLKEAFRSDNPEVRGSIDKTITILLKVWQKPPAELKELRNCGLELLKVFSRTDSLAIHWGMVMAAYPFWSSVATQAGRLLRLQASAAAAQVQRRIKEQYGERETVARRARYVLRSFCDWGVLKETEKQGVYSAGSCLTINDNRLSAWLVEAALNARINGSAPLKELVESPCFFPFQIKSIYAEALVSVSPRLDILRQGLDDDLIMLRK